MSNASRYFSDAAPEYLRDVIAHKAQEIDDRDPGHNYLKPGAPRWMADIIRSMEDDAKQIHQSAVEDYRQKSATWLMQIDGFVENPGLFYDSGPGPGYHWSAGYQLANAGWDARLYVVPSTTREQAIILTAGFLNWLVEMSDEEFNRDKMPQNYPRVLPPNRIRASAD